MKSIGSILASAAMAATLAGGHGARAADSWTALPLSSDWTGYGHGYRAPAAILSRPGTAANPRGTVILSGMTRPTGNGTVIATLPSALRPAQRMVFGLNGVTPGRIELLPDGQVVYAASGKKATWISLEGIQFSLDRASPIGLGSGFAKLAGYAPAGAVRDGGAVMLNGVLRAGPQTLVATLPTSARPDRRLIFNAAVDGPGRLDVLPDGRVYWVYRAAGRTMLSLQNVLYETKQGQKLALARGWRAYGQSYREPSVSRVGDRVVVSGVAAILPGGAWNHIATLPAGACPKEKLIFSVNNHDQAARVDVWPDCRILWVSGGHLHGWLSLDGIAFLTGRVPALPTHTGEIDPRKATPKPVSPPG